MDAQFSLDNGYLLRITGDVPRLERDALKSVAVQIDARPITRPLAECESLGLLAEGSVVQFNGIPFELCANVQVVANKGNWELAYHAGTVPPTCGFPVQASESGPITVFAANLRASHARAIASALLSAATEARE